jgi:hypothetical protein
MRWKNWIGTEPSLSKKKTAAFDATVLESCTTSLARVIQLCRYLITGAGGLFGRD